MVSSAIQSVLSLLVLIGIGYYMASQSWYPSWGTGLLSKICVRIAIPAHMFHSTITTIKSSDELMALLGGLPVPYFTILFSLGVGLLLARALKIPPFRRGVFLNAVAFSNTVLIGFVVVEAIFGGEALPDAMVYYMANTTLFWTIGTWLLRRDSTHERDGAGPRLTGEPEIAAAPTGSGSASLDSAGRVSAGTASANRASAMPDSVSGPSAPAASAGAGAATAIATAAADADQPNRRAMTMDALRNIFSPPLIAFFVAIGVVLLNLKLPGFILASTSSLRQMTTPLAMLFIGGIIRGTDLKQARVSRDLALVMIVRFLATPVIMVLILTPLPITVQMKQIFFLMSTMPVMTQLGIMSKESNSDYQYASMLVTITTAFSMLAIPAYLYLIERFQIF